MSKDQQHHLQRAVRALLGERPIAYHTRVAKALKSASAGIFVSQLLYWSDKGHNEQGWIWKTREEIYDETALSRYEQEGARKVLKAAGVLEEKLQGVPARMHFRVNLERLVELLSEYEDPGDGAKTGRVITPRRSAGEQAIQLGEKPPTSWGTFHQPVGGKTPSRTGEKPPAITETTSETTAENTHHHGERVPAPAAPAPRQGSDDDDLASLLVERGVSTRAASLLVRKHPAELIRTQVSYFNFRAEAHSSQLGKNPAGFLRRSIEENYPAPQGYVDPEQKAEARRRAEEKASAEAEAAAREEQERLHDLAMEYLEPAEDRARRSVLRREETYRKLGRVLYINDAEREAEITTLAEKFRGNATEFFAHHPEFDHLRAEAQGENVPASTQPTKPKKGRQSKLSAPEAPTASENGREVGRDLSSGGSALRASQTPQNSFLAHRRGELSVRGSPG